MCREVKIPRCRPIPTKHQKQFSRAPGNGREISEKYNRTVTPVIGERSDKKVSKFLKEVRGSDSFHRIPWNPETFSLGEYRSQYITLSQPLLGNYVWRSVQDREKVHRYVLPRPPLLGTMVPIVSFSHTTLYF